MKYQIIGKNIEITEGISTAVQKKLANMDKYFVINDEVECRVVCSTHINVQKVEVTIFLPKIKLRAEVENPDLYAAIDLAVDKLEGQMRKLKTRMERSKNKLSFSESIHLEDVVPEEDEEAPEQEALPF
jgi:putative sigma-54 modulation protein